MYHIRMALGSITPTPSTEPHKILLRVTPQRQGAENRPYLFRAVVERKALLVGVPFPLVVAVENLGSEDFPGGEISTIFLRGAEASLNVASPIAIPVLPPGSTRDVGLMQLSALAEGLNWLHCSVKSNDGRPVQMFKEGDKEPQPDWYTALRGIDPEKITMLELLQAIADKLDEIKGSLNR